MISNMMKAQSSSSSKSIGEHTFAYSISINAHAWAATNSYKANLHVGDCQVVGVEPMVSLFELARCLVGYKVLQVSK